MIIDVEPGHVVKLDERRTTSSRGGAYWIGDLSPEWQERVLRQPGVTLVPPPEPPTDGPPQYRLKAKPGGYYEVYAPDGAKLDGPSNGKWQGRDAAAIAAWDHLAKSRTEGWAEPEADESAAAFSEEE